MWYSNLFLMVGLPWCVQVCLIFSGVFFVQAGRKFILSLCVSKMQNYKSRFVCKLTVCIHRFFFCCGICLCICRTVFTRFFGFTNLFYNNGRCFIFTDYTFTHSLSIILRQQAVFCTWQPISFKSVRIVGTVRSTYSAMLVSCR